MTAPISDKLPSQTYHDTTDLARSGGGTTPATSSVSQEQVHQDLMDLQANPNLATGAQFARDDAGLLTQQGLPAQYATQAITAALRNAALSVDNALALATDATGYTPSSGAAVAQTLRQFQHDPNVSTATAYARADASDLLDQGVSATDAQASIVQELQSQGISADQATSIAGRAVSSATAQIHASNGLFML